MKHNLPSNDLTGVEKLASDYEDSIFEYVEYVYAHANTKHTDSAEEVAASRTEQTLQARVIFLRNEVLGRLTSAAQQQG